MYNQVSEISEKRLEVLHHLDTHEGEIVNLRTLANLRVDGEASKSDIEAVRGLVKRMDNDGLVNYESSYSGSKVSLTTTGKEELENAPYPPGNVGADVGADGLERFHGFVVEVRILSDTPSDWMGVMQEREEVEVIDSREGQTTVCKDIWNIRLHKGSLTLQLREGCSISGNDSADLFRRAHSQAQSVCRWLEGAAGIRVQVEHLRVKHAELGFEGHPLAELAGSLPGVPLDRFSIEDPDLREQVLTIDGSPGWTEELEAQSEMAEEISQNVESEMGQLTKRDALRARHGFEDGLVDRDVSGEEAAAAVTQVRGMQERMHETVEEVEGLEEKISDMSDTQEMLSGVVRELQETRENEKGTRDALMELVRSNQNVIRQNNERMEKQEEIIERQEEIIEGQQEQISSLQEKMQGLEEKLEDLQEGTDSLSGGNGSLSQRRPLEEQSPDVPGDAELQSVDIDTEDDESVSLGIGNDNIDDTEEVEASDIREGLCFRDVRGGDVLLEVRSVGLVESSEGYYSEAVVEEVDSKGEWARMPVYELARLLNTDRLKITDIVDPPM